MATSISKARNQALRLAFKKINSHIGEYKTKKEQDEMLEELIAQHSLQHGIMKRPGVLMPHKLPVWTYRQWFQDVAKSCAKGIGIHEIFLQGSQVVPGKLLHRIEWEEDSDSEDERRDESGDEAEENIPAPGPGQKRKAEEAGITQPTPEILSQTAPPASENPSNSPLTASNPKTHQNRQKSAQITQGSDSNPAPKNSAQSPPTDPNAEEQSNQQMGVHENVNGEQDDSSARIEPSSKKRKLIVQEGQVVFSGKYPARHLHHLDKTTVRDCVTSIYTTLEQETNRWCSELGISRDAKARWDDSSPGMHILYEKLFGADWRNRMNRLSGTGDLTNWHLILACLSAGVYDVFDINTSELPWKGPKEIIAQHGTHFVERMDYILASRLNHKEGYEWTLWEAAYQLALEQPYHEEVIFPYANKLAASLITLMTRQIDLLSPTEARRDEQFWHHRERYLTQGFATALNLRQRLMASPEYYELEWVESKSEAEDDRMMAVNNRKLRKEVSWAVSPLICIKFTDETDTWKIDVQARVFTRDPQPEPRVINPLLLQR